MLTSYWATKTPEERAAIAKKAKDTLRRNKEEERRREEEVQQRALELRYQIDQLQAKLDTLQKMEIASSVAMHLTNKTLLHEEEIVNAAVPYVKATGVYFLVNKQKIVYVGQSNNIFNRLGSHAASKEFESFAYVPCKAELLDKLESLYIHLFRPPLNGDIGGRKVAPLSLEEVLMGPAIRPWRDS